MTQTKNLKVYKCSSVKDYHISFMSNDKTLTSAPIPMIVVNYKSNFIPLHTGHLEIVEWLDSSRNKPDKKAQ